MTKEQIDEKYRILVGDLVDCPIIEEKSAELPLEFHDYRDWRLRVFRRGTEQHGSTEYLITVEYNQGGVSPDRWYTAVVHQSYSELIARMIFQAPTVIGHLKRIGEMSIEMLKEEVES